MAADMEQELAEFNSPVDADKPSTPKPLYDPSPLYLEEATYPNSCLLSFFFLLFFMFVSSFQFLTIFRSRGYDREVLYLQFLVERRKPLRQIKVSF